MKRWKLSAFAGASLAALTVVPVVAFKPNETEHGHRMITEGVLFAGYSYGGASVPVFTTTLSDGKDVRFSSLAASHVMLGNKSTDLPTADFKFDGIEIDLAWELTNPVAHCDDELIEACSERIRSLRDDVVRLLKAYITTENKLDLGHARGNLGKALHTLQDFYAHSNHADVHTGTQTFVALTGNAAATAGAYARGPGVMVCEARSPTLAWVLTPTYANNGGNWKLTGAGLEGGKYTTGWFTLASAAGNEAATDASGAKCDHGNEGGLIGSGFSVVSGISKDVPYAPLDDLPLADKQARGMPSALHVRASHQAAVHTREFLDSVIAAIKVSDSNAENQDKMIKALLGIDSDTAVFGFVLDRTGSMGGVIEGVKTQIQKLIDDAVAAGGDAATRKFMIVDYGDPDVSTPVVGTAAEIKAYLGTVFARGGGDCPEKTNTALKAAVGLAPRGSSLYVFTDASSNDGGLAAEVLATAQSKSITISYAASGSCSPIDPTYYSVANGTGGQVIEVEHTPEGVAAAFTAISIDDSGATAQPAIIEAGTLAAAKTIEVPVEGGATRLSIVVNNGTGTIEFVSPAGAVVPGPNVVINDFLGGRGLKVTNPVPGTWAVRVNPAAGGTEYSVRADVAAASSLDMVRFYGTTPGGRTAHEGPVEYAAGPPIGPARVEVVLRGAAAGAPTLEAVSAAGETLSTVTLTPGPLNTYAADVNWGTEPFRVRVRGAAATGQSFVRMLPTLYTARPFTMEIVDVSQWALGIEGELRVKLTNHGPDQVFALAATSPTAGTVRSVEPASVTLARGESRVVSVKLAVAPTADLNTRHALDLTAVDAGGASQSFRHYVKLSTDTDGDGVPDTQERGLAGNDPTYDGNGDGLPDWTQPGVASMYSRQQRGYVTFAVPAPAALSLTSSITPPAGAPTAMPLDMFDFRIVGVSAGGAVTMRMILPQGVTATSFAKYGPEPEQAAAHWYTFASNGPTGATIDGNVITLRFIDGARGDDDLAANGIIVDAGGPAGVVVAGIAAPQDTAPPPPVATGGGGGGGGCTVGDPARPDWSLSVLALLAAFVLWVRRTHRRE